MSVADAGKCPKCLHDKVNPLECDYCGIVFAKYAKSGGGKPVAVKVPEPGTPGPANPRHLQRIGLVILSAVILVIYCLSA